MLPAITQHYTSLSAAKKIIETRSLRLTNVFFMNDSLEVEWLRRRARDYLRTRIDDPNAMPESLLFYSRLRDLLSQTAFDHVYCSRFSEACDNLSQWRGYSDGARGVSIGFDLNAVMSHKGDHRPMLKSRHIEYRTDEHEKLVSRQIEGRLTKLLSEDQPDDIALKRAANHACLMLNSCATECKNPTFSHEKEIRIIASLDAIGVDPTINDEFLNRTFARGLEFFERNGELVPFTTIEFPIEAIKELWLGPRFGGANAEGALRLFLSAKGVVWARIR